MDEPNYMIGDRVKLISDCYAGFERNTIGRVKTNSIIPIIEWDNEKLLSVNQLHLVRVDDQGQIKPPLGLRPRNEWIREREREIIFAMNRYSDANLDIPRSWACELLDLTDDLDSLA